MKNAEIRDNAKSKHALAVAGVLAIGIMLLGPAPVEASTANPYLEATGSMTYSRTLATASPLPGGKVLVTGGFRYSSPFDWSGSAVKTAEVYDDATGEFTVTGSMANTRTGAASAPLPDGRILVFGGSNTGGTVLASTEVYDPTTGEFSSAPSMLRARSGAIAKPLPDGRILVAGGVETFGGEGGSSPETAEIYDPASGEFETTGSMAVRRVGGAAATLPDGRILLVGGEFASSTASAEIYDPATGTFGAGPEATGVFGGPGSDLPDGTLTIFGSQEQGLGEPPARRIEQFDPVQGTFSTASATSPLRDQIAVAPLPGGRLLLAGGRGDEEEAYLGHAVLPVADVFVSAPSAISPGLDFGEVPAGEVTGPEALTVSNLGAQELEIESVALAGPDAASFEIVEDGCEGETLAFEGSCVIAVSVAPSGIGPLAAAVELVDNAPSSPDAFPLAAEGVGPSPSKAVAAQGGTDSQGDSVTAPAPAAVSPTSSPRRKPGCRKASASSSRKATSRHKRRCARTAKRHAN